MRRMWDDGPWWRMPGGYLAAFLTEDEARELAAGPVELQVRKLTYEELAA